MKEAMVFKQPRQDLDLCGCSLSRYSEKCFTQINLESYVLRRHFGALWRRTYQKHLSLSFSTQRKKLLLL